MVGTGGNHIIPFRGRKGVGNTCLQFHLNPATLLQRSLLRVVRSLLYSFGLTDTQFHIELTPSISAYTGCSVAHENRCKFIEAGPDVGDGSDRHWRTCAMHPSTHPVSPQVERRLPQPSHTKPGCTPCEDSE